MVENFISIKDLLEGDNCGGRAEILLQDLNEEQQDAVKHTEGPVLILAGAGSGKTRALTYRIAYLLESGISPYNILALTFTNKAAREMKERIAKISIASPNALWMGTFHSIFSRLLRIEADKIGYTRDFIIYDIDDSVSLLGRVLKELNLEDKDHYKPKSMLGRISNAKSTMISSEDYTLNHALQEEDRRSQRPKFSAIYSAYQSALRRSNAMDFDDLLFYTYTLFQGFPDVLGKYRRQFRYILVDEYQDTSRLQYLIIKTLAVHHRNLCVVGDDSQSIYAFRGATIQNILDFKEDYPDTRIFKLEQNYRSSGNIVGLSNAVIAHNKHRLPKTIWTSNANGAKVQVFKSFNDRMEGEDVASRIAHVRANDGGSWCDFAVLYRTNRQSKSMEDALRRQGIPYKIYGNVSFYQRKEIKNVLAYCRWAVNPYDEQALLSCINNPRRGIGDTSIDRLQIFARENGVPMWDLIKRANSVTAGGAGIAGIAKAVKTKAADIMGTDSAKGAKVENVKITEARKARNAGKAGGSDTANWNDGNIAEAAIVEANSEKDAKAGNAKITEARKTRNVGETDIDDTANWSDVNIADAGIPAGTLNKMATLALKVEKWYMLMPVTPADELLETIWAESDLKRAYEDEATSESKDRIQNVEELIGSVREWVKGEHTAVDEQTGEMLPYNGVATLAMFLPEIALLTDQDTQDERDERNSDKVVLMTIHSAKGLEFPYVFVAGLEDGLFPSSFGGERCDLEEERRLFYVAITRAKKQLWLSCAGMRFLHGNLQSALPSPFLLELDSQYAEVVTNGGATGNSSSRHYGRSSWAAGGGGGYGGNYGEYGKSGSNFIKRNAGSTHADGGTPQNNPQNNILPRGNFKKVGQAKSAPPPERIYVTGQKVIHNKFGKGTILEIMGDGSNQKLIIDFSLPIGTKTLLATFAKLEVI